MSAISTVAFGAFNTLLAALKEWREQKILSAEQLAKRRAAIQQIKLAVIETRAYLHDSEDLGNKDRTRELNLARQWQLAGDAVRDYDYNLWEVAEIKALGWSDPSGWAEVGNKVEAIQLDRILAQCKWLESNESWQGL